jgi:hypothetical protein
LIFTAMLRHLIMKAPHHPMPGVRGFALVVTLSLMILLTLIAVGLLTLSSVSLRAASQGAAAAQARANARLALMMAIGQLQVELGPDQRINATADQAIGGLTHGRQRWVGTWDSWLASVDQRPTPKFNRWLVSGNPTSLGDPSFPSMAPDLVALMRDGASILMSAPRLGLEDGGLAYVTCDENSKARLGPSVESDREDMADHLSRIQTPPAGHAAFAGLAAVPRNHSSLDLLASTPSVELVPGSVRTSLMPPASFTVWSEGLLTDVRNGGFRKDLSLFFQNPDSGDSTKALYQNGSRRGINFKELRDFHEVSTRLTYDASSFAHPDGGGLNRSLPCLAGQANQDQAATEPFFAYLRPVVLRGSWHISAFTRNVGNTAAPSYRLYIVLEPIVWLWNPFDVNLVMRPGGHQTSRCWGLPYVITIKTGSTTKTVDFNEIRSGQADNVSMEIGQNTPVVMRPGEVLIYSRGRQATTPSDTFARFEGKLGWSGTGGFSLDTGVQVAANNAVTLSMKPSTKRGAGVNGLVEFLSYVGTDIKNDRYWYGGLMIDRQGWGGALTATEFPPAMFTEIPDKTFTSAANLATPQPLALFSYLARTERDGSIRSRYLARLSPGSLGTDHQAVDPNTLHSLTYEPLMQPISGGLDRGFDYDGGKGFYGGSYKADNGVSYLVTHSVPRERPVALGSFQHALANGVEKWYFNGPGSGASGAGGVDKLFHDRILQPSVTHAIGNSFAPPCIAPDQSSGTFNSMPAVDHSYLANRALWDEYFVSSLAERSAPLYAPADAGTARILFERLAGINGGARALPNRHYRYAGQDPVKDVNDLFSGALPMTDAYLKVASVLRIHGAFNINSTDPAAWLAMFQSTRGFTVPVEPCDGTASKWESAKNPFAGLLIPKGSAVTTSMLANPSSSDQWTGYRDPTDEELKELADAMVVEVRKRGPFLCYADFVNRRLDNDTELASRGALQAALDSSINKQLESGPRSSGGGERGIAFPKADAGSQVTHVPGHVKQGDILSTLGTRFTPRSDTFTIRAYGEARSPTGALLASARCEAVIQRVAAYIDPVDKSDILPAALVSQANKRFGRKFNLVSFRWIAQDES